jgi:tetratricopeptide (TPR) repeat protein
MRLDPDNPVVQLCVDGMQAEAAGELDTARELFQQAWDARLDDVDACVAAHYLARRQTTAEDVLLWNQRALDHANAAGDERVRGFYPSLYLNMGWSCEQLGRSGEAQRWYVLAAGALEELDGGDAAYGEVVRDGVVAGLRRLAAAG